jgi:uncharacterized protein DUF4333
MGRARYLVVIAALAFAGCGSDTLDAGDIESEVVPQIEEQTGTRDVEVACPDDVEAEEGAVFECDVSAEGGIEAKLKVTQEDGEGNVRWEIVQP